MNIKFYFAFFYVNKNLNNSIKPTKLYFASKTFSFFVLAFLHI